jgi:folate-dependent tRNA-U54 methylase TrmFO/GidA
MNANFGLLEPLPGPVRKADKRRLLAERALADLRTWAEGL